MSAATTSGGTPMPYRTHSLCPACLRRLPATVAELDGEVMLQYACPEHGERQITVWRDAGLYRRAAACSRAPDRRNTVCDEPVQRGCPLDCGLCAAHQQRSCLVILEVTRRCDLGCPVCLADAGGTAELTVERFQELLRGLKRLEGGPAPLQLSGGEPTAHPQIEQLVALASAHGFSFLELNTNGLRLAREPGLARRLARAGLGGVYLQFDGLDDDVYRRLRGRPLLDEKQRAIDAAIGAGLSVVLAVTVARDVNLGRLWEIAEFAAERGALGVNFQAFAPLGRYPDDGVATVTLDDMARALERGSRGALTARRLLSTPFPPFQCMAMAYLLKDGESLVPVAEVVGGEAHAEYVASFASHQRVLSGVAAARGGCCCGARPEGTAREPGLFTVSAHAMMSAGNVDASRASRCCIHRLCWDGKLRPFCLSYLTSTEGERLYG